MKQLIRFFLWCDRKLACVELWALVSIILGLTLFSFFQVVLRNFFHQSIDGADIVLRHLVLWLGFIGASLATRERKHITIDIFSRIAGSSLKTVFALLSSLFSVIICALLTYASFVFVIGEREFDTILFGSVRAWWFEIIIPMGFLVMGLRFLASVVLTLSGGEGAMNETALDESSQGGGS